VPASVRQYSRSRFKGAQRAHHPIAANDRLKSARLLGILLFLFDVAKLCLGLAENPFILTLRFQHRVGLDRSRVLLELAFRFSDTALDLLFVHVHIELLLVCTGVRPVFRSERTREPQRDNSAYAAGLR